MLNLTSILQNLKNDTTLLNKCVNVLHKTCFCSVLIKSYLRKIFCRFTADCNEKPFSGKHT